jgi:hypothetical protein
MSNENDKIQYYILEAMNLCDYFSKNNIKEKSDIDIVCMYLAANIYKEYINKQDISNLIKLIHYFYGILIELKFIKEEKNEKEKE